jgi:hypothetical protein
MELLHDMLRKDALLGTGGQPKHHPVDRGVRSPVRKVCLSFIARLSRLLSLFSSYHAPSE